MDTIQGHNMYKSLATSLELSVYFEKYKIIELVTKILFEISKERPSKVDIWLAERVKKFGYTLLSCRTFLLTPPSFDNETLLQKFEENYDIPTIVYTGKRDKIKTEDLMKKFDGFIKAYGLEKKHKIFVNFPKNCIEIQKLRQIGMEPTNIIEVRPDYDCDNTPLTAAALADFAEVRRFYSNISRIIHYGPKDGHPANHQTIEDVMHSVVDISANTEIPADSKYNSYCYRIVIYGRRGSGRKTQALTLAKRYNLILLNAEDLIMEQMASESGVGEALRNRYDSENQLSKIAVAAAVHKRIMQRDCVEKGWVLVAYPYDKDSFEFVIEKFLVPPNRVIFLHCRERLAIRRLVKQWQRKPESEFLPNGKNSMRFVQQEMDFYNLNKVSIYQYLKEKYPKTIHIDGNHSFETVKKVALARVCQQQNVYPKYYDLDELYDIDHYECEKRKFDN